jgi:hypothetical protein
MVASWLGCLSALLILVIGAFDCDTPPGDCVRYGCKAAVDLPPAASCAHGLVTWSIDIDPNAGGIKHGSCRCPALECVVENPDCAVSGVSVTVSVKNAANSIEVGGVNFGKSFTWSPGGTLSGCGNSNFEIITVTGPGVSCTFALTQSCRVWISP